MCIVSKNRGKTRSGEAERERAFRVKCVDFLVCEVIDFVVCVCVYILK